MKMYPRSKKGFTLVEIMIVVVIIGLLAAMAIPAFTKVRRASIGKAMANDARQIGAACQQIALEYPADCATGTVLTITSTNGTLTSAARGGLPQDVIANYVKKISRGTFGDAASGPIVYTFGGTTPLVPATNSAFNLFNAQVSPSDVITGSAVNVSTVQNVGVQFDEEGKAL